MTQYQLTLDSESVQHLFTGDGQLGRLVEAVLNQVLNAQVSEQLQAAPYERSDQRQGYRNGYKPRQLTTRVGALTLLVPQVRDGRFSTELFARYQRSEQALVLTLMEMVVNGVSTRKMARITEELCGTAFARSTVSDLCKALDPLVTSWNERDLSSQRFPFVLVDALVVKVREAGRVRAVSALVATGVSAQGYREILGLQVGDSASERTWQDFFTWLKGGAWRAWIWWSPTTTADWSRPCRCSFRAPPGSAARRICRPMSPTPPPRRCKRRSMPVCGRSSRRLTSPPHAHCSPVSSPTTRRRLLPPWQRWSEASTTRPRCWRCPRPIGYGYTPPTALSGSTRRFADVNASSAFFPNRESVIRLVGALLMEQDEVWTTGKRYFDMTAYWLWRESRLTQIALFPPVPQEPSMTQPA